MRLSGLDMAFLCLEETKRPMHMGALLVFEPSTPVHPVRTAQLLATRSATAPLLTRVRRSTWWPPFGAAWAEDDAFVASDHVHTHRLRDPGQLAPLVATVMAQPLPLECPPWRLDVITGVGGGRFAVLATMHHALSDAAGALAMAGTLLDGQSEAPTQEPPDRGAHGGVARRALRASTDVISAVTGEVSTQVQRVGQAVGIASSTVSALRPQSVVSPVSSMVGCSGRRRWASVRLDADALHRARKQLGGTFHDVVLSVVAGGLGGWLGQYGDTGTASGTVRVFIPVSLRGRHAGGSEGGNHLSGYLVDLPVDTPDPLARFRDVRASMQRSKAAGTGRGAGAFPVLAGMLPAVVHRVATPVLGRATPLLYDTMVTSAPLPDRPLRLDGALLRELHPIAPLAPGQGLSVALATYRGGVHVGLLADDDLLPGADRLGQAISEAAGALHRACAEPSGKARATGSRRGSAWRSRCGPGATAISPHHRGDPPAVVGVRGTRQNH